MERTVRKKIKKQRLRDGSFLLKGVPVISQTQNKGIIYSLRDSGKKFRDPSKDIRGRDVIGRDGKKMGTVDDLLLDDQESRIRFVQIAHGGFIGFGRDTYMLPVNTVTKVEDRQIRVDYTAEEVEKKAIYMPELEDGVDTGPAGWFEQGPGGVPGVAIQ